MSVTDLLEIILARLSQDELVLLNKDEVTTWGESTLKVFTESGFLKVAPPPKIIECQGCEQNCPMPVNVKPIIKDSSPREFFIWCDKRDDIGLVNVEADRLEQWHTSFDNVATFIAKTLSMNVSAVFKKNATQWHTGNFKGYQHKRPLILSMDEEVNLLIAGHTIPLLECLIINDDEITINKHKLNPLVDNPIATNETAKERKERLLARKAQLIKANVTNFLQVLVEEEGVSKTMIQKILRPAEAKQTETKRY